MVNKLEAQVAQLTAERKRSQEQLSSLLCAHEAAMRVQEQLMQDNVGLRDEVVRVMEENDLLKADNKRLRGEQQE